MAKQLYGVGCQHLNCLNVLFENPEGNPVSAVLLACNELLRMKLTQKLTKEMTQ